MHKMKHCQEGATEQSIQGSCEQQLSRSTAEMQMAGIFSEGQCPGSEACAQAICHLHRLVAEGNQD